MVGKSHFHGKRKCRRRNKYLCENVQLSQQDTKKDKVTKIMQQRPQTKNNENKSQVGASNV